MLVLYKPKLEELWFREKMLSDADTMSYNAKWGGTIPFPKEKWSGWYDLWVSHCGKGRFYRYLLDENSGEFVGETAYHLDTEKEIYLADIIILSEYRRKGYGKNGLALLCQAAGENGCAELYDDIAADNPARRLFLNMGFAVEYETEDTVMLKKVL